MSPRQQHIRSTADSERISSPIPILFTLPRSHSTTIFGKEGVFIGRRSPFHRKLAVFRCSSRVLRMQISFYERTLGQTTLLLVTDQVIQGRKTRLGRKIAGLIQPSRMTMRRRG